MRIGNRWIKLTTFSFVIALILTFIKLPFYITQPGMATEIKPMVEVEGGYIDQGTFALTTVRIGRANVFSYLWAQTQPFYETYPVEDVKYEGESDEEYIERQIHMMESSQQSAVLVAYKAANKDVSIHNKGVRIMQVIEGMPAKEVLKNGDIIKQVDGQSIQSADDFIAYVKTKNKGDQVLLEIEREGDAQSVTVEVAPFPDDPEKSGIGISLVTERNIETSPSITLNTEDIGGPSAGLMMSLEIYNQLTEDDVTKGRKIAGTGTINENGEVGPIGGIAQKVVAAHEAGMEIFFAPNEEGIKQSNYEEALKTAKEINTTMKIVPVDTFDDALSYLQQAQ